MMKVPVPTYADPIQLKTLNGKLAGNILQVVRGSDICFVIQKPVHWFYRSLNVDPFWAKALRSRRRN
jgi:hypothetical protein